MENLQIKVNLTKIAVHITSILPVKRPNKMHCNAGRRFVNYLQVYKVYLNLTAMQYREQKFADSHFLKPNIPKEKFEAMTKEEGGNSHLRRCNANTIKTTANLDQ